MQSLGVVLGCCEGGGLWHVHECGIDSGTYLEGSQHFTIAVAGLAVVQRVPAYVREDVREEERRAEERRETTGYLH